MAWDAPSQNNSLVLFFLRAIVRIKKYRERLKRREHNLIYTKKLREPLTLQEGRKEDWRIGAEPGAALTLSD